MSVSRHFLLQTPQCPCSVRKRFSRDHCRRGRSKPGCRIVGSHTIVRINQARCKGAENESPYRRRVDREAEGVEVDWEWVSSSPAAYRFWRNVVISPRPKTNFVHSRAARKPLMAIILSILKSMFYTRTLKI